MKKILMIGTGGTIASEQTSDGLAPALSTSELLSYVPEIPSLCEVDSIQICSLDSTNVTPQHWQLMVKTIEDNYNLYDGFVLCHGTDTLAYTAAALSYMIQHSPKPIVLTGAQKPISDTATDAKHNLLDSFLYATDDASCDVSIVFNGKVIAGTRARKDHTFRFDAFSSINFPYPAAIQSGKVIRFIKDSCTDEAPAFFYNMNNSIYVLKLIPGMNPAILSSIFQLYDCIIIEGFGVGGIPETLLPAFDEVMNRPEAANKLIVMATQVVYEGSRMDVYQVGQQVCNSYHLLETFDMTIEAAVAKLMWITASFHTEHADACSDWESWQEQARELFYTPVNHDISTDHLK